jgi:peptidoglycan/LPS O-acetylase OafA/YrhL
VSIFFCLSGFLIMTILLREERITFRKAVAFIVRRFMRVYPAYLTAIIVMLILMKATYSAKSPELIDALPGLLSFTKLPGPIGMETGVFWTLYIEFWFYVTMPFIVMIFGRGQALVAALGFLIVLSLFFKIGPVVGISIPNLGVMSQLIFWIDNLLYGSLVAILAFRKQRQVPESAASPLIYGALVAIAALAVFVSSEDRLVAWPFMATAASLLTAVIVLAFISLKTREFRMFSLPWAALLAAWLGRISYSIYLYHAIPLDYHTILPKPMILVLPLIIILVAATSYYLIESPGMEAGRKLAERIRI